MQKLDDASIAAALAELPAWKRDGDALVRTFDRGGFDGSIAFINAIARAANLADHHPDLELSWNEVTVRLSSHDVGGISARDFRLAGEIDAIAV